MRGIVPIVLAGLVTAAPGAEAQHARAASAALKPMASMELRSPASLEAADRAAGDPILKGDDALLVALFGVSALLIAPVDRHVAERLQNPRNQANRVLRISAEGFNIIGYPGSLIIGTGLLAHGHLRDDRETAALGLHGLEAIVVGSVVAGTIKSVVGRARPYMDVTNPHDFAFMRGLGDRRYRSFPSGHTVAGFAAATVVTAETRRWWPDSQWYIGPAMYGGAALIGASRMYTNNHWASDVVIGAAIGTLAGVIIDRYHRRNPDNWLDRKLLPDEGADARARVAPPMLIVWSIPMPR